MKGFVNPDYPMSNHTMTKDRTWGGTHPALRPNSLFSLLFSPRVIPERPDWVGTSKIVDTIVQIDLAEAAKKTGMPFVGQALDPPEYRFLKGNWQEQMTRIVETMREPDPHPLHRTLKTTHATQSFKKYVAAAGDGPVSPDKVDIDATLFSRAVKQYAYDFGAEAVGITKLNRNWVWKKAGQDMVPEIYTHVIILAVRHLHWRISHSPAYTSDIGSWVAYHRTSFMAVELADFIRSLGYHAKANSMLTGYDISMPPHEIEAGMGEQSRIGVTLHPVLGPAYKVAAVLTSFPLITDKPIDFRLQSFCEKCEKCARTCPSNAIPSGSNRKMVTRGVLKWQLDAFRCYSYWTLNNRSNFPHAHDACARCIYVCPWTKHNSEALTHRLVAGTVSKLPWLQSAAVKMDDLMGYGKQRKADPSWERWF